MVAKREDQEEADEVVENCGQEGGAMKRAIENKLGTSSVTPKKKLAKKMTAPTKVEMKSEVGAETAGALKKRVREKGQSVDTVAFAPEGLGALSGQQSGDLQGLSNVPGADSESVDELLEEGNSFEPGVVKGVKFTPIKCRRMMFLASIWAEAM